MASTAYSSSLLPQTLPRGRHGAMATRRRPRTATTPTAVVSTSTKKPSSSSGKPAQAPARGGRSSPRRPPLDEQAARDAELLRELVNRDAQQHVGVPTTTAANPGEVYLRHNWAPVREEYSLHELDGPSQGHLPADFPEGTYLRNGPNPCVEPRAGDPYGWFDGCGMVHALTFTREPAAAADGGAATSRGASAPRTRGWKPSHRVLYTNRWVRTGFLHMSERSQRHLISVTVQKGLSGLWNVVRTLLRVRLANAAKYCYGISCIVGTANTSLSYFPIREGDCTRWAVLAMYDSDAPYELDFTPAPPAKRAADADDADGRKGGAFGDTLGYNPLGVEHPMTPHPRYDPVSGEMISFGVGMPLRHLVRASTPVVFVNAEGEVYRRVDVPLGRPRYNHDFVITENFVILQQSPSVLSMPSMLSGGAAISWDERESTAFTLLPRTRPDDPTRSSGAQILFGDDAQVDRTKTFALPPEQRCFVFHYANGWEEVDAATGRRKVVMFGSHYHSMDVKRFNDSYPPPRESIPRLYRFEIDVDSGAVTKRPVFGSTPDALIRSLPDNMSHCDIDNLVLDFCNTSWKTVGRSSRYIYTCFARPLSDVGSELITRENPDPEHGFALGSWEGVLKIDLHTMRCEAIVYPKRCNGGEVIFQPRNVAGECAAEDDGWLLSHVTRLEYDAATRSHEYKSYTWVMDAQQMSRRKNGGWPADGVVYSTQLPQRLPWGLHSLFISKDFTDAQKRKQQQRSSAAAVDPAFAELAGTELADDVDELRETILSHA